MRINSKSAATAFQNALAFYGPTEWAYIDNCVVDYMKGSAIVAGLPNSMGNGHFVGSRIQNCRF